MQDFKEFTYHRVTDILSPFSGIEFIPEDVLNIAANRGTRVHEMINGFYEGFESEVDEETSGYMESFNKFHSQCVVKPFKMETRFFDDAIMCTGKMDMLGSDNGVNYIYDWKTSYKPSKTWALQAAAYRYLTRYEFNAEGVKFVQLKKNGDEPEVFFWNIETLMGDYLPIFFKCLDVYKHFEMWNRPLLKKRKNMENQGNQYD